MKERVPADKCSWYTVRCADAGRPVCPVPLKPSWAAGAARRSTQPAPRTWLVTRPAPRPPPILQGPALFELLDSIESQGRDSFAPFRMPIMDKYRCVG